ncbi:MAG: MFS transporter [Bacillota bacterium]
MTGETRHLSGKNLFTLSTYWFAVNFHWGALLVVVIPAQVLTYVDDAAKAKYLSLVFAVGALVAMVTQPVTGSFSDRCASRWGRRRPFMAAGTLLNVAGLMAMAYAPTLATFTAAFMLVQLGSNIGASGYQGLLPDLVPESQRGTAAGYVGVMNMLGTITAAITAGTLVDRGMFYPVYWIISLLLLALLAVTASSIREEPLMQRPPMDWRRFLKAFWVSPREHPDFAWLLANRALVMLGFYTLLNFLQYYLADVTGSAHPARDAGTVSAVVLVGAALSSFAAGWLSDRIGRKGLVAFTGLLMAATCLAFITGPSFMVVLAFALIFGLGYGGYISVELALATEVLPSAESRAKDMGIWGISVTLPQVIAPLLGGQLLYTMNRINGLGYPILFATAVLYFVLGSMVVYRIRKGR